MSKHYIQKIFRIYDEAEKHLAQRSVQVEEGHLKKSFTSVYSPGPSYQFIFDFPTRTFDYVSDDTYNLLGIPPDAFDPETFFHSIHPDDYPHFHFCEELAGYFLLEFIPRSLIPFYKVSYQFRHKLNDGSERLFLRQSVTLTTDESGKMSKTMSNHSDISHITSFNNRKVSFIDITGRKSYFNIGSKKDLYGPTKRKNILSRRELDIIKLVSEGFSSKDISDHLFISFDTVRTHRKNILKKTGMNNMPQVVAHCIKEGII